MSAQRHSRRRRRQSSLSGPFEAVLICGGCEALEERLSSVELFDPRSLRWVLAAPLPSKRAFTAAVTLDNKVILMGGHTGLVADKATFRYCPILNKWTAAADLNRRRCGHQAVALDGHAYVLGGDMDAGARELDTWERYDTESDTWTLLDMRTTPRDMFGMAVYKDTIYFGGGYDRWVRAGPRNDLFSYCPRTNKLTQLPDLPHARAGASFVVANDCLMVVGGQDGDAYMLDVDCYDFEKQKWSQLEAPLPIGRPLGAAFVINELLAVAGGSDAKAGYRKSTDVFSFGERRWQKGADMAGQRANCAVSIIQVDPETTKIKLSARQGALIQPFKRSKVDPAKSAAPQAASSSAAAAAAPITQCTRHPRCPKPNQHAGRCKVVQDL